MGRLSYSRIINILRERGHFAAADDLERILQTEFNFGYGHKRVLIVLFVLGTLSRPIRVPQRQSRKNPGKYITDPRSFWQAIEWLFQGTANTFKGRYQELKANTNFVIDEDPGTYGISIPGVKRARELIEYDKEIRNFFFDVVNKLYDEMSKRATYLRNVLKNTGNWHPIEEEKLSYLVEGHI